MPRSRWRWIKEDEYWKKLAGWLDTLAYGCQVQVVAGLDMVEDYGPEGNTRRSKEHEDIYTVFAYYDRVIWVVTGVAWPQQRDLLPLAWGTELDENHIEKSEKKAATLLKKWRAQHEG